MTEDTATAKPVTAIPQTAARLSFAGAATFLALLIALHFIKPELDPSWRMVSEYELGRYGWVMMLAFLSLASSCATLFVAIRSEIHTIGGKIGLAFLLVAALGMTIAAIFTSDPITASQDELTTHGTLHGLGAALGIPGFPIAATLISLSLARNPAWSPARRLLLWTAGLNWISLLVFVVFVAVMLPQSGGKFGPEVLIGWPNRLFVAANSLWLMVAAWRAARLSRQRS
ncbi:MAG: DUF998 domain-containing protein [Actinomycetota bacterium]|nr:DUF998 domain-containing protein [Actinomycetota bacterium]